jgi:hypothetical protein
MTLDITRHPALADESPCDKCSSFARCAAQLLACSAFSMYINGRRWRNATRLPSAEGFAAIYASDRMRNEDVLVQFRIRLRKSRAERGTKPGRKPRMSAMEATC